MKIKVNRGLGWFLYTIVSCVVMLAPIFEEVDQEAFVTLLDVQVMCRAGFETNSMRPDFAKATLRLYEV